MKKFKLLIIVYVENLSFFSLIDSFCRRSPYNFILKYSKEITNTRKLDGFVNTILAEAGIHGHQSSRTFSLNIYYL